MIEMDSSKRRNVPCDTDEGRKGAQNKKNFCWRMIFHRCLVPHQEGGEEHIPVDLSIFDLRNDKKWSKGSLKSFLVFTTKISIIGVRY